MSREAHDPIGLGFEFLERKEFALSIFLLVNQQKDPPARCSIPLQAIIVLDRLNKLSIIVAASQ